MTLNRSTAPIVHRIEGVEYIQPVKHSLENGTDLYVMKCEGSEIIKLDLVIRAGSWYNKIPLAGTLTSAMLMEGTHGRTSMQIAKIFDFYGAQTSCFSSYDNSYISLLCLKKHFESLIQLLAEVVIDASFPENEFEMLRQKRKQRTTIEYQRVAVISQKAFMRQVLGFDHHYSPIDSPDQFDRITREDILDHYKNCYASNRMFITATGDVNDREISLIKKHFGQSWGNPGLENELLAELPENRPQRIDILKSGISQAAITMGRRFPNHYHSDFPKLKLLICILGGYFGSRLMSNIREDKGYTYSIHAHPISLIRQGLLIISAEVKNDKRDASIHEITHELNRLCEDPIGEEELISVQNYMLGRALEDFDGPFARAQTFSSLLENGLDFAFYDKSIDAIKFTTPNELRELASKYLNPKDMSIVSVGNEAS